jgi:hypothetical protein
MRLSLQGAASEDTLKVHRDAEPNTSPGQHSYTSVSGTSLGHRKSVCVVIMRARE